MPYTTNTAGTTITASWGNANVRDQVVTPFADSTARSSAISVPVAGMLTALTTTGRLDIYNGSSWSAILSPVFGTGTAWSPALTATSVNPTLGSGSSTTGAYFRMGRLIVAYGRILFGSSGAAAGTGTYQISMPVTGAGPSSIPLGVVFTKAAGASTGAGVLIASSTTLMNFYTSGSSTLASNTVPGAWTNNDAIGFLMVYEAGADG